MSVLSGHAFRKVSAFVQLVTITVLVILFFTTPLEGGSVEALVRGKHPALYWFPGFSFIGLYKALRPATWSTRKG